MEKSHMNKEKLILTFAREYTGNMIWDLECLESECSDIMKDKLDEIPSWVEYSLNELIMKFAVLKKLIGE